MPKVESIFQRALRNDLALVCFKPWKAWERWFEIKVEKWGKMGCNIFFV